MVFPGSVILEETEHLTALSELFIHEKNYSIHLDLGNINICKIHIKVFF